MRTNLKKIILMLMAILLIQSVWAEKEEDGFRIKVENSNEYPSNGKTVTDIMNILTSISTIKGTQYYSQSAGEMTTLFTEAYVIDSEEAAAPQSDPVFTEELPQNYSLLAQMEDSRFGTNNYLFCYQIQDNHINLQITNLTKLKYAGFKAVDENNFIFLLDIFVQDDKILVNNTGLCSPVSVPFMEKKINSAITNRINALLGWFEGEITK
ncbi:MAG: hypothetical protein MJ215_07275 [Spirochaetia bacterium]|nr:hypothetical protein [Spirochaetia bacterium]